ncbi:MAG: hypothetical protein ACK4MV_13340 [Beijerinckiaceae bacterium]
MNEQRLLLRIHPLSHIALFKIYMSYISDDDSTYMELDGIIQLFDAPVSRNLLRSSLALLERGNRSFINVSKDSEANEFFSINERGIVFIEEQLTDKSSLVSKFASLGDSSLTELAGLPSSFGALGDIGAEWEPLPIDRESKTFKEAEQKIDEAIRAIESDNGFAANEPETRDNILASLKQGQEWLRSRTPSRAQIQSMLLKPLRWISEKFGQSVVGEIAKEAAKALLKWLDVI